MLFYSLIFYTKRLTAADKQGENAINARQIQLLKRVADILPQQYRASAGRAYFAITSLRYVGSQVQCPCCGGSFRMFLTSSVHHRANSMCPRCLSLERHRLLWLYLTEKTNFFSAPLKVLHFAPELCFAKFRRLSNLDYTAADLNSPLAAEVIDITAIPYPDSTFDVILCNHVLEHIPDDRLAMRELYRVLKPEGWAILQSPLNPSQAITFEDPAINTPEQREQYYGHHDHKRLYGQDYKDRLSEAGFHVTVDDFVRHLDADVIATYGLMRDEAIYFCTKR